MSDPFPPGISPTPTDMDVLRALVREMKEKHGRCRVVEVGTWLGATALVMLGEGAEVVHCVDTWEGTNDPDDALYACRTLGHAAIFNEFRARVGDKLHHGLEPHVGKSVDWAKGWGSPVELVFIDGDHREESVAADIAAWSPHLVKGGVLCGHDYGTFAGVEAAVRASGPFKHEGNAMWVRRL